MSDNYDSDDILKLYENKHDVITTEKDGSVSSEPTLNFLQLISIFESEESDTMSKFMSQKPVTAVTEKKAPPTDDSKRSDDDGPTDKVIGSGDTDGTAINSASTSSVAVAANHGGGDWTNRPERNLLVVIHPWCMLRKSGADRQSEFPPPGFLDRLKAKLLAIHRETEEQRRQGPAKARYGRHGHGGQTIKCWFRYTAAAAAAFRGHQGAKTTIASTTAYPDKPAVIDFLTVRRRYAAAAAAATAAAAAATPRDKAD